LPRDHLSRKSLNKTLMVLVTLPLLAATGSAQGRGGSDSAQAARQAAANKPRTIDGINTVWIDELTQPELRDMIRDGYTTVLIMTGGVVDNSANLSLNKHNLTTGFTAR
jgi:creatinine amidohydrolase